MRVPQPPARALSVMAWVLLGAAGVTGMIGQPSASLAGHELLAFCLSGLMALAAVLGLWATITRDVLAEAIWLAVLGGEFLVYAVIILSKVLDAPGKPLQGVFAILGLAFVLLASAARLANLARAVTRMRPEREDRR